MKTANKIEEVRIGQVVQFGDRRYVISGAGHPNMGIGHSELYLAPFGGDPESVEDINLSLNMANAAYLACD